MNMMMFAAMTTNTDRRKVRELLKMRRKKKHIESFVIEIRAVYARSAIQNNSRL